MQPRYEVIRHPRYKYRLVSAFNYDLRHFEPGVVVNISWVVLDNGRLYIRKGYAWDGPSGPALDTVNFLRASLVHDALYQLIGGGYLPRSWKKDADKELYAIARADGMPWWRAAYAYAAVVFFGPARGVYKPPVD